jgi:glutamate-ammonia-ligase adenylyltransferase
MAPPHVTKSGRQDVAAWLKDIAGTKEGKSLTKLATTSRPVAQLMTAIAEGSPYLWNLIQSDPARWMEILDDDPDRHLASLLQSAGEAISGARDDDEAKKILRQMKARASLLIAAADIGGVWDLPKITRALTAVADTSVSNAVRHAHRSASPNGQAKAAQGISGPAGYIVLALGKMGAHELNYSSDIDLMVFFDPSALAADVEPVDYYVRRTRSLIRLLQERTVDGYVFRVDLRLRPDPASTQIAISVPAALDYYERRGQNWERAAMIKARPCAGDIAAGDVFLSQLSPFIWRKYLDYGALADIHAMKQQIHVYRGHEEIAIEGHNVKLGRGGIREIEFFAQTQQLIAGGRHPELRGRETLATLAELARGRWIKPGVAEELDAAYRFLRAVEHRLQMVADEQTHTLPEDRDAMERFSRFMGFADRDQFAEALLAHLRNVQRHYYALFEEPSAPPGLAKLSIGIDEGSVAANVTYFSERGFARPAEAAGTVRRWFAGDYRSLRGERTREHLADLLPSLIADAARADNPDAALQALDRFLAVLHGGPRLLSLLRQNRDMVALLGTILATAPRLADILAQQPEVIDAVLEPAFFGALPDRDDLERLLAASLRDAATFEDVLDQTRRFGREHQFLIGVRIISGTVSAAQAGEAYAKFADVLIAATRNAVEERFVAEHGRVRGGEWVIVALGKLGGREMTAGSDLDLIVAYDFDQAHQESDGKRPLAGSHYFARLTQRFINALTVPTNFGRLYDVDMRLRPSGRSGPLATSFQAFDHYQHREAWTWEHMVLTRARVVCGSEAFARRIESLIRDVLCMEREPAEVAVAVRDMRRAVAVERGEGECWNIKDAAGGLLDIEFLAQYLQLAYAARHPDILDTNTARVLDNAARLGVLAPADAEIVRPAVRLYHNLTQILRLCVPGPFDPNAAGAGLLRLLARAADVPDFPTLEAYLADTQARVRDCFERMLARN